VKSLADLLPEGARVVVRPMDARIPYEQSFVVEATIKSAYPDRTWPHAGLSPRQRERRPEVERDVAIRRTMVAEYMAPAHVPGTSTLLGFATRDAQDVVCMVYVKRDFRGYGLGGMLLGGEGKRGDMVIKRAVPLRANRCWQRWVLFHA
jgi:hypothetical protein